MAGPYRCTNMLVKIDSATIGVVNAFDITLTREGGTVEHVYGSVTGYISHGGDRATFTLQRWFYTDTDTDLLYDLFNDKSAFELTGEVSGVATTTLGLSGCKANSYKWITGDANSIVGEEVSGEAVSWSSVTDIA